MTTELLTLIVLHFACADLTEARHPSHAEIEHCSDVYDEVRLAFVPGVSAENFADLSLPEQTAVRTAGYLAFWDWREANADTVAHLRRVARGEEKLRGPRDL